MRAGWRWWRGRLLGAACAALLATALLAAPTTAGAAEPQVLTNPGAISQWAFVNIATAVRSAPDPSSPRIGRLGTKTEDGTSELVLLLEQAGADGQEWVRVRMPGRPAGRTGWVPREALGSFRAVRTWLQVDTQRLRATLIRGGKVVFRAPVAVGRARWPTPRGEFYIRTRLSGYRMGRSYGPLAFGTSAASGVLTGWPGGGVIGIHGTDRPRLIPGRVSHGCIRLRNRDILRLGRLMPVGTPLTIS